MITVRLRNASMIAVVALAVVIGIAPETHAAHSNTNAAPAGIASSESAPIPASAIALAGVDSERPRVNFEAFRAALDGYGVAVENRVRKSGAESDARFQAASRQVTHAGRTFLDSIRNATDEADRSRALKDLDEFDGSGKRLVSAADDQRALQLDYYDRVRAMAASTREAIDEAWMLFGRVFARDSLVALKAELAELRRRSERLDGARGSDLDAALDALAAGEQAIAATLNGDRVELSKSQGSAWFEKMLEDLASLSDTRTKLQRSDVHQSVMKTRFADLGSRLKRPIELVSRFVPTEPASQEPQTQPPASAPESASSAIPLDAAIETPPLVPPPRREGADGDSFVSGWVTGTIALLLVVLAVVGGERRRRARSSTTEVDAVEGASMAIAYDRVAERLTLAEQTLAQLEPLSHHSENVLTDPQDDIEQIEAPQEGARISVSFDDVFRPAPKRAPAKTRLANTAAGIDPHPAPCSEDLLRMLESDALELALQPELNPDTLEVESVVARVSTREADFGLGARGEILALPDEPETILPVCEWALRSAVEIASRWHQGAWPQVRISMDVPPAQLMEPNFVERLQALLDEYLLPPQCIEIGITDASLRDIETRNGEVLRRFHALGLGIALNDFGKSLSSLALLEQMPLTRIKLDPSLAIEVDAGLRSSSIARNLIGWARRVGLRVTHDPIGAPEQFALALREVSSCSLRHFVRPGRSTQTTVVDPLLESAPSYGSVIVFRHSFVLKAFEPGLRDVAVTRAATRAD